MASQVQIIKLNDGTTIPWLAFGTGTGGHIRSDVSKPIELALRHGILHIDTAQGYKNEQFVGEGLASYLASTSTPREKIYVTTKFSDIGEGQSVRSLLVESLVRLKLAYVDLFLIHTPMQHLETLEEVWAGMEEVKKEGLAKSIGVSNFRIRDLERIIKSGSIKPAVNQIEYHPYLYKISIPLLEYHAKHGIITMSFGGMTPLFRFTEGPVNAALVPLQERLTRARTDGKPVSDSQVLLKWLWHKGIVAVTTTTKEERMDEYVDADNVPDLTSEEIKAIDDAGSSTHYRGFKRLAHMDEN